MDHDYEAGRRDGKIEAIEAMLVKQEIRLDNHELRLTAQERIIYAIGGVLVFLQVWPSISGFIGH